MAETDRPPVRDAGSVAGLDGRALVSLRERWPTLRFVDYASFAILLQETDGEGAFVVAEKVRDAVAAYGFRNSEGERTEQITVSIGLSTYPGTASDREGLLRRADDALYVVKRSGRNRVSASPAGVKEMRARDQEVERCEQAAAADERGGL